MGQGEALRTNSTLTAEYLIWREQGEPVASAISELSALTEEPSIYQYQKSGPCAGAGCAGAEANWRYQMPKDIVAKTFDNPEFGTIRAMCDENREPWFVAKDICDALGLGNVGQALARLDEDEKSSITLNDGTPGNPSKSIVSEAGLYSLVLKSRKPEAHAFKRWVTHEVLPAIRRDGGYMVARNETPEETMARAVLIASKTIERQKAQIDEMRPKALFADAVAASDGTCLIGELAKMMTQAGFTIGQNRLFEMLRNDGFLGKSGSNRNVPLQRYVEMGLFKIKETAITHADGHVTINRTPKVTGKGQRYFIEFYLKVRGLADGRD